MSRPIFRVNSINSGKKIQQILCKKPHHNKSWFFREIRDSFAKKNLWNLWKFETNPWPFQKPLKRGSIEEIYHCRSLESSSLVRCLLEGSRSWSNSLRARGCVFVVWGRRQRTASVHLRGVAVLGKKKKRAKRLRGVAV